MYNYHNNNYRGLWHQLLTISCWHYDCQNKFDSETVVEESIYQCWLWNWLRIWSSHLSFSSGPVNHTEVCHTIILESRVNATLARDYEALNNKFSDDAQPYCWTLQLIKIFDYHKNLIMMSNWIIVG